jgi:hypothetical protein
LDGCFKFVELAAGLFEGLLQYLCLLGGEADVLTQLFDYVAFGGDVAKDGADEAAGKTAAWSEQSAGQTADGATSSCSTALAEQQRESATDCRTANGAPKPAGESATSAFTARVSCCVPAAARLSALVALFTARL